MNLAENIHRYRTGKNMSQLDLAEALEVSRQSVSKWETGTAVPELDKLVKMATLFDVSLDELVNDASSLKKPDQPPPEIPEPKVIYIDRPAFPAVRRQHIIGVLLLAFSLIFGLLLYNSRFSTEETLFLVLPVAVCGAVCLLTSHPLFCSGWICACAYWGWFFVLFPRWEQYYFLIALGVILPLVMSIITLRLRQKELLRIPAWAMILGGIVLILLFILLCMNCIPFTISSTYEAIP